MRGHGALVLACVFAGVWAPACLEDDPSYIPPDGDTSTGDTSDDGCMPGLAGCECVEGLCLEGLSCVDDVCQDSDGDGDCAQTEVIELDEAVLDCWSLTGAGACEYVEDPWVQSWSAGEHTLTFMPRESPALADVVVTNDPGYGP